MQTVVRVIPLFAIVVMLGAGPNASRPYTLDDDFVRGVNHAHIHRRGHGYGSTRSKDELAELRAIGVNWIAVTPFGYQPSATADGIAGYAGRPRQTQSRRRTDPTLTDADLAREIESAHALGIKVLIKPHIWSRDFRSGEWHGTIRQDDAAAHVRWWASYRAFTLHFAELAQRTHADAFCIGTELAMMTESRGEQWRKLIRDVRDIYDGPVTYAAHWDREIEHITFWDELDAIGVSAYFPLSAPAEPTVEQLAAAWAPHRDRLAQLHRQYNKPVVFLELGYRDVAAAHVEPWVHRGGERDTAAQARAYEAMFQAWSNAPWWRGLFIWKTFTSPALADRRGDGTGHSFRGKPAEGVLRQWFGGAPVH